MQAPLAQPLIDHRDQIARLCEEHGVLRLDVFGSAANGRFDPARSDYDFIVRFSPGVQDAIAQHYVALADALEHLLGRRVDLMTDQPVTNPYLHRAIEATRREFYVRAPAQTSA